MDYATGQVLAGEATSWASVDVHGRDVVLKGDAPSEDLRRLAIERLTREVIDSIGSEKVVLRIIDIAENEALADRYQAGWSALILDRNGRVENLTRMGFSYAKDQPATFKARLNDAITRMSK